MTLTHTLIVKQVPVKVKHLSPAYVFDQVEPDLSSATPTQFKSYISIYRKKKKLPIKTTKYPKAFKEIHGCMEKNTNFRFTSLFTFRLKFHSRSKTIPARRLQWKKRTRTLNL